MKFIVDAQLPPALARFLAAKGEDIIHVVDVKMMASSDSEIWELALKNSLIIITKDEDFQIRASVSALFPKIVWVRIGNCSRKSLLNYFEQQWTQIKHELDNGANLVELVG